MDAAYLKPLCRLYVVKWLLVSFTVSTIIRSLFEASPQTQVNVKSVLLLFSQNLMSKAYRSHTKAQAHFDDV